MNELRSIRKMPAPAETGASGKLPVHAVVGAELAKKSVGGSAGAGSFMEQDLSENRWPHFEIMFYDGGNAGLTTR